MQATIHPAAHIREVTLKVADLERILKFYNQAVGLQVLERQDHSAVVGAGGRPILHLDQIPGALKPPASAPGLYHNAILFPDRYSLAVKIAQLSLQGFSIGQADHLVSEAFYLSDPEGNGLELYRDRPQGEWKWSAGQIQMATDPIDIQDFFQEIGNQDPAALSPESPPATRLGHIHLRVTDLDASHQFYCDLLGFDVMARAPGALFVSAGGYHHHIGMNTWQSRGGQPAPNSAGGLREFTIALPDETELEIICTRIESAGLTMERHSKAIVVHDPAQNRVRLSI